MVSVRFVPLGAAALLGIVLAAASCDRNRNPISPPSPPPGSTVVRLELEAPAEIPPGESAQLTANAFKADGSVENVSSRAVWTPPNSPVLQVSATGLATGRSRGEMVVTAVYAARTATARIFVLPRGTFRLSGTIKEDTLGVPGVSVTVISGVGEGQTTTTDPGGNYALYGVSGTVRIQIRREAYLEAIHEVSATSHRTADFNIVPERPRADYRGNYRLTVTAASNCRSLPESAKARQYSANVVQDGSRLTVTLRDANFIVVNGRGNGFTGTVDINGIVRFTIGDVFPYYDYYYATLFDIAERVDADTVLTAGIVSTQASPTLITGKLNGSIVVTSSTAPPFLPLTSWCGSPSHGFEMVPR